MSKKIHDDAFAYYVSLQGDRSYTRVAERYKVSERAVQKAADREHWTERLGEIQRDAQERTDKQLADEIVEMNKRHRQLTRGVLARAAKALTSHELKSAMEGIKAAEIGIKLERMMAGEPGEHTAVTVEQVTKQEIERMLVRRDEPVEEDDDASEY